jgi:hypothetical protein
MVSEFLSEAALRIIRLRITREVNEFAEQLSCYFD